MKRFTYYRIVPPKWPEKEIRNIWDKPGHSVKAYFKRHSAFSPLNWSRSLLKNWTSFYEALNAGILEIILLPRGVKTIFFIFAPMLPPISVILRMFWLLPFFFNTRRKTISRIKDIWQSTDQEVFFSLTFFAHASLTQFCREVSSERSRRMS